MRLENKMNKYVFTLFIIVMNTALVGLELDRLFRREHYIGRYGISSSISEADAMEMLEINQLRASIQSWVFLISVVLFIVLIKKFSDHTYNFFFTSFVVTLLFSLISLVISILFPFHIIELISPLTLSLLMSVTLGIICFLKSLRQKYLVSEL